MILSRDKPWKLAKLGNITKKFRCLAFTTGTRQYFSTILLQKDSYYTDNDSWGKWRENMKNCKLQSSVINRWSWPIGGHMTVFSHGWCGSAAGGLAIQVVSSSQLEKKLTRMSSTHLCFMPTSRSHCIVVTIAFKGGSHITLRVGFITRIDPFDRWWATGTLV